MPWLFVQYLAIYEDETFANGMKQLANVNSKCCQMVNKAAKNFQSGEISPNLVPLKNLKKEPKTSR